MSKNFEEEYIEYLNAQAPDLWERIEAGISASPQSVLREEEKVVPIRTGQKKRTKKKKQIRYQHYRAIVSAAACLFALLLIIPVYMLTKPSGKSEAAADAAEEIVLTDATITNTTEEAVAEEAAMEESAPAEAEEPEETVLEETTDDFLSKEPQTGIESNTDSAQEEQISAEDDMTQLASAGQGKGGATDESAPKEDAEQEADAEAAQQEELVVVILAEEGRQEAGMLYTASVVGSASQETISIIVPDDSIIVLEIGGQYAVSLQQYVEEGYRVVLNAVRQ